jgi:hypothetical protein
MTHARTKVHATVKTDSAHFLTVDLGFSLRLHHKAAADSDVKN